MAGPSLEAELHQPNKDKNVAMLGLDVYNGSRTQLAGYGTVARVTFPLLQEAAGNTSSFSREDLVVVGQDGIVRFYGHVASATARKSAQEVITALLSNRPLVQPILSSLFFDREVPFGETRSSEVTIQNIGNAPLEVTGIQAQSGNFTSPDLPITIAPGTSQKIDVVFTADDPNGVVGNITFLTNADPFDVAITPISVTDPPAPALSLPQTNISFGTFDLARSPQQQITIQNTGQGILQITNIQSDLTNVTISSTSFTLAPGESKTITIALNTTQSGPHSGTLQITSNDPTTPTTTIAFSGTAQIIPAEPKADANGNGTVDFADFLTFAQSFGKTHPTLDFNNNGTVDFTDFVTFAQSFGKTIN